MDGDAIAELKTLLETTLYFLALLNPTSKILFYRLVARRCLLRRFGALPGARPCSPLAFYCFSVYSAIFY